MNRLDSLGKVPMSIAIDDRDVTKHDADPRTRMCHGARR